MAARAKVEFIHLTEGTRVDGRSSNLIESVVSSIDYVAVSTIATSGGSRPAAPAPEEGRGQLWARVTALDNPVIVAWGSDPTASNTSGVRLPTDQPECIPVVEGDLLSFLETT
jgi:hypothetical protein